jgi:hypothetical protein
MPYANAAENRFLLPFCRNAQKKRAFSPVFFLFICFFAARARFCRVFAGGAPRKRGG